MKNIMDRVAIEDAWYTKAFGDEIERKIIYVNNSTRRTYEENDGR